MLLVLPSLHHYLPKEQVLKTEAESESVQLVNVAPLKAKKTNVDEDTVNYTTKM